MPNPGSTQLTPELTVTWSYDAAKQQLTVSAVIKGTQVDSTILRPGNKTGTLTGSSGGTSATVGLDASFAQLLLQMNFDQLNPNRNGASAANF